MTHAYFCFYHCLANVLLRRLQHALKRHGKLAASAGVALLVFSLSYATAFAETATIANFPYYNFKVRACACTSLLGEPCFGSTLPAAHNMVPTLCLLGGHCLLQEIARRLQCAWWSGPA